MVLGQRKFGPDTCSRKSSTQRTCSAQDAGKLLPRTYLALPSGSGRIHQVPLLVKLARAALVGTVRGLATASPSRLLGWRVWAVYAQPGSQEHQALRQGGAERRRRRSIRSSQSSHSTEQDRHSCDQEHSIEGHESAL